LADLLEGGRQRRLGAVADCIWLRALDALMAQLDDTGLLPRVAAVSSLKPRTRLRLPDRYWPQGCWEQTSACTFSAYRPWTGLTCLGKLLLVQGGARFDERKSLQHGVLDGFWRTGGSRRLPIDAAHLDHVTAQTIVRQLAPRAWAVRCAPPARTGAGKDALGMGVGRMLHRNRDGKDA
jgi:hypothetical protein